MAEPGILDPPEQGVCWVCVEINDDWTEKELVAYDMGGNRCVTHRQDVYCIEQITDPVVVQALEQIIGPNTSN